MADYSIQELMIIAAAREIADGELVFVGMRLPITAYGVARLTHAPNAVGLFECGIARYAPAADMLYTMGDPPNQLNAAWTAGLIPVMSQLQRGRIDAGFIGGAEVDRYGNVNSSYIGDFANPDVKLPGSGGAADIAAMSKRLLVIMNHDRRRLVEKVDYVTSPGYLDGGDSRKKAGLKGGPSAVITDKAILRPHGPDNEMHLASIHEGHNVDEISENTGWNLKVLPEIVETQPPSPEEMAALHKIDKDGFWR
jgi:glutaconate CoA-transferase, subunit B